MYQTFNLYENQQIDSDLYISRFINGIVSTKFFLQIWSGAKAVKKLHLNLF